MFDTVAEFKDWWLTNGRPLRPPFDNASFHTDNAMSLCLYREGNCQVELYITAPDSTSPPHTHPGVDSMFVYLGGNIVFFLEGRDNVEDQSQFQKERSDGAHMLLGATVDSPDGIPHWLKVGPEGSAFLSFERWKEKIPTSVTVNWEGDYVGQEHKRVAEAQ